MFKVGDEVCHSEVSELRGVVRERCRTGVGVGYLVDWREHPPRQNGLNDYVYPEDHLRSLIPKWTPTVGEWVKITDNYPVADAEGTVWGKSLGEPETLYYVTPRHDGVIRAFRLRQLAPLWDGNYDAPELETEYDGSRCVVKHLDEGDYAYSVPWEARGNRPDCHPSALLEGFSSELDEGFLPSEKGSVWSENRDEYVTFTSWSGFRTAHVWFDPYSFHACANWVDEVLYGNTTATSTDVAAETRTCTDCLHLRKSFWSPPCFGRTRDGVHTAWTPKPVEEPPHRACGNCLHAVKLFSEEPCSRCHGSGAGDYPLWTPATDEPDEKPAKTTELLLHANCKYDSVMYFREPCAGCHDLDRWEPAARSDDLGEVWVDIKVHGRAPVVEVPELVRKVKDACSVGHVGVTRVRMRP